MRLTGGDYRGRRLRVPTGARPTGSRVREALFSILGQRVVGGRFLDLFAGAGVVGLEALSRGAGEVLFVDHDRRGLESVRKNAQTLGATRWRVLAATLPRDFRRLERFGRWDIVFADPPYAFEDFPQTLSGAGGLLAPHGILVVEHASRRPISNVTGAVVVVDQRRYGESSLTFCVAAVDQSAPPPGVGS